MSLDRHDLERIAELAALDVPPDRLDALAADVSRILELVAAVSAAVSDGSPPPEFRPGPEAAPLRADVVRPSGLERAPEHFAPEVRDGFFVIPRPPGVGEPS